MLPVSRNHWCSSPAICLLLYLPLAMVVNCYAGCPPDFAQFKTRCYNIGAEKMTHSDAEQHCNNLDAHLVRPPDPETNAFIATLGNRYSDMWIGLEPVTSGGEEIWRWADGSDVNYPKPWYLYEPASSSNYALLRADGFWAATASTTYVRNPVCETEIQGDMTSCEPRYFMVADTRVIDSDDFTMENMTVTSCIAACQSETSLVCLSAEFHETTSICVLSEQDESTVGSTPATGWDVFLSYCEENTGDLYESPEVSSGGGPIFSASGSYSEYTQPDQGRLYQRRHQDAEGLNYGVWVADTVHATTWFEVDFTLAVRVDVVISQGIGLQGAEPSAWTDSRILTYRLLYSQNRQLWHYYTEQTSVAKDIPGTWQSNIPRAYRLLSPVIARYLRVNGRTREGYNALRFGVLGTSLQGEYELPESNPYGRPLGLEDGYIMDAQLSSSDHTTLYTGELFYPAWTGRLHFSPLSGSHVAGAWKGKSSTSWIMVDLLVPHVVTAIAVQGYRESSDSVTATFSVAYKPDGDYETGDYIPVTNDDGTTREYTGAFDASTAIHWPLGNLTAQLVRIVPILPASYRVMRFEVYGQPLDNDVVLFEDIILLPDQSSCTCNYGGDMATWCGTGEMLEVALSYFYIITKIELSVGDSVIQTITLAYSSDLEQGNWTTLDEDQFSVSNVTRNGDRIYSVQLRRAIRAYFINVTVGVDTDAVCGGIQLYGKEASVCPPRYVHHKGRCYWSSQDKITMDTEDMRGICGRTSWVKPGYLVTLNDPEEQQFVLLTNHITTKYLWLGLFATPERDPWIGNVSKPSWTWRWMDGSSRNESIIYWDGDAETGQPDESQDDEVCATLQDNLVHDTPCTEAYPYTCETPAALSREISHDCGWTGTVGYIPSYATADREDTYDPDDINECMMRCVNHPVFPCKSLIHNQGSGLCRLASTDSTTLPLSAYTGYVYLMPFCPAPNEHALLWEAEGLGDDHISGKKFVDDHSPFSAIYGHPTLYYQATGIGDKIQVDFSVKTRILRIAMQGAPRPGGSCRVVTYRIWSSNNSVFWEGYRNSDFTYKSVLGAPSSTHIQVEFLMPPIHARFLRLESLSASSGHCMRFEVYGTPLQPIEHRDKGCAVEIFGHGATGKLKDPFININGRDYMTVSPLQGLHVLEFDVGSGFCITTNSVQVFDVAANMTEQDRFIEFITALPNDTYIMGTTVDDLGTTFYTLQDSLADFGVNVASMTAAQSSLVFIARKGHPDWAKQDWGYSSISSVGIWRYMQTFPDDEAAYGALGMESGEIMHSQIFTPDNCQNAHRGRLYDGMDIAGTFGGWTRSTTYSEYLAVDLRHIHVMHALVVQGTYGYAYFEKIQVRAILNAADSAGEDSYSADDNGNTIVYSGCVDPRTPVVVRLYKPMRVRYVLIYPSNHIQAARMRMEILGYPERLSIIALEEEYTTVRSQGDDPSCDVEEMLYKLWSPDCDRWCPESVDTWIEILTERWYQLSGVDIGLTSALGGNFTFQVDVQRLKHQRWVSLLAAPQQAFLDNGTVVFSPVLLTNSLRIDINGSVQLCVEMQLFGQEAAACPTGMMQFEDRCYYISESGSSQANAWECQGLGKSWIYPSHMADIRSHEEAQDVRTMSESSVRVGVYSDGNGTWMWSNGTVALELPWWSGAVLDNPAVLCSRVDTYGRLTHISCSTSLRAVCEIPAYVRVGTECLDTWQVYNSYTPPAGNYDHIKFVRPTTCFQYCVENAQCRTVMWNSQFDICYLYSTTRLNGSSPFAAPTTDLYERMCIDVDSIPLLQTYADGNMVNVSATDYYSVRVPANGILYSSGFWGSLGAGYTDIFQIAFGGTVKLFAIGSQGAGTSGYHARKNLLFFRATTWPGWVTISKPATGTPLEIWANIEPHLRARFTFPTAVIADHVDVRVSGYAVGNYAYQFGRFELYGYFLTGTDSATDDVFTPLGLENGFIVDSQLGSSKYYHTATATYPQYGARLNREVWSTSGFKCPLHEWISVSLYARYVIFGVAVQGNVPGSDWVTGFKIYYADGDVMRQYADATGLSAFSGPYSGNYISYTSLVPSITSDVIRISPTAGKTSIPSLRLELYGQVKDAGTVAMSNMTCGSSNIICEEWCPSGGALPLLSIDLGSYYHVTSLELNVSLDLTYFNTTISRAVHMGDWFTVRDETWSLRENTSLTVSFLYHANARYIRVDTVEVAFSSCLTVAVHGQLMPACPPSYVPYGDYCYATHRIPSSRTYALQHCQEAGESWVGGGQLARVSSERIMAFLGRLLSYSWTPGYQRIDGEVIGNVTSSNSGRALVYEDGTPVSFLRNLTEIPSAAPLPLYLGLSNTHMAEIDEQDTGFVCQLDPTDAAYTDVEWNYAPQVDVALPEAVLYDETGVNKTECLRKCLKALTAGCASLVFSEGDQRCVLLVETQYTSDLIMGDGDWQYFDMASGGGCTIPLLKTGLHIEIAASSELSEDYVVSQAIYGVPPNGTHTGGWRAATDDLNQNITIKFPVPMTITSIIVGASYTDVNSGRVTEFRFSKMEAEEWVPLQDSSDGDEVFSGTYNPLLSVTQTLTAQPKSQDFLLEPLAFVDHVAINIEIYGCVYEANPTCFSTTESSMSGSVTCFEDWIVLLRRSGPFTNPGLTPTDYTNGFEETNFMWYGTEPMFLLTKDVLFNLRIEMWTSTNDFYFAEYIAVRVSEAANGYSMEIQSLRDGSHGDGGLIHRDVTVPFVTTDTFNINDTDCATEDGPVFGWWIYWIECNQTLLTADAGAQWLAQGPLPTDISVVVMDKVTMRITETYPGEVNVAYMKTSSQSSTVYDASLANDGSVDSHGNNGECAQTDVGTDVWWKVDLLKVYRISSVDVYGREDCCFEDLHDFDVLVGLEDIIEDFTGSGYVLCAHYIGAYDGNHIQLTCTEMVSGRYVVILISGTNQALTLCEVTVFTANDVLSNLNGSCSWGADCAIPYSACIPALGSREENYTCQCKRGYQETSFGECMPVADISLQVGEIVFATADGWIRDTPTSMTVHINMTHAGGASLQSSPDHLTNFILEFALSDGVTMPFSYNYTADITITTGWDPQRSIAYGETVQLTLAGEGFIPADGCHAGLHLCFWVKPGNASTPTAYIETSPENDYACIMLDDLHCQPVIDIGLSDVQYLFLHPIVRETDGIYGFSVDVTHVSGTSSIAELQDSYNYVIEYAYSTAALTTISETDSPITAAAQESLQSGLGIGETKAINFTVTTSMSLSGCADVAYICVYVYADTLASFVDSDATLANNIACMDITSVKMCEPEMLIEVQSVQPAPATSITRGYEDVVTISVTILNADVQFDVPAVTAPAQNFNITASCRGTSARRKRTADSLAYSIERSKRSSAEVGPFTAISDATMSSALVRGDTLTLDASIGILLPRNLCNDLTDLCIMVEPGTGASYSLYTGTSHMLCIGLDSYKNCEGLPVEDLIFQPTSAWLPEGVLSEIVVSWSLGTDVEFTVDFQDGVLYDWLWNTSDHTISYREYSTVVTHTYERYANYTLQLHICSSVDCTDDYIGVVVEPLLEQYLMVELDYTPRPPPTPTRLSVKLLNDTLYPVLASCAVHFLDSNITEDVTFYTSISSSGVGASYTYLVTQPSALCITYCENHVGNVTFSSTVALQENITGLTVLPLAIGVISNTLAEIELSVINGSNIVFEIDYGDETMEVVNNSDSYTHQVDFTVSHQYTVAGNYTISVTASNVHFRDSAMSVHDVIVQNEVTQMSVDCVTPVAYPPGVVTCNLVPDTSIDGPTDPYCDSQLDGISVSQGTHLPSLGSQIPVAYTFNAAYSQIGPNVTIDIHCHNLVSSQNLQFIVGIYEEIQGLGVDMENMGLIAGELGTLYFTVTNGSSVEFQIDFGDGNTITVMHPLLFASDEPLVVSNTYTTIGNYSIAITATNPLSDVTATIPEPVVVQHRITDMALNVNESILWPREPLTYILRVLDAQETLYDIHCSWFLNDIQNIYRYLEHPIPIDDVVIEENVLRQHVGNLSINLTCSNLVSSLSLLESTNVILDAVMLSDLRSNGSVWWQNVSGLVLDIARFAEYSCFLWDMGDGAGMFLYGVASCETDATSGGWPFTEIEDGTMTIGQDYIYETFGRYTVSVFAYNDVSNHTLEATAVVWEWTCLIPNISVNYNQSSRDNPIIKMRSEYFVIHMMLDKLCFFTRLTDDLWRFIDIDNGNEYLNLVDLRQFIHYPRTLPYGLYEILFMTQMQDFPETENSLTMYLEIVKTPLNVSIIGGTFIALDFGIIHTIDAISLTSDPDVDPGDISGITFNWDCVQYNTSELEYRMRPRMPNYNATFPSNRTQICLAYDPQIPDIIEGSIDIITDYMYPMVLHRITVSVVKDTRTSSFEQFLYIGSVMSPSIAITCRENCAEKAASTRPIVLKITCLERCENPYGGFYFRWILFNSNSSHPMANLSQLTQNGDTELSIFLRENSLPGGNDYIMVAEGWTPGSDIASAQYDFTVNLLPYGGTCEVQPREGIASETPFIMSCQGWLEWQPQRPFDLEYTFNVRQVGSARLFPVFFGPQSTTTAIVLPVGSVREDFLLESVIQIYDSVGDYTEVVITVNVHPKDLPGDVVLNNVQSGVSGENSIINQLLNSNMTQEAATNLFAFISEINVPADMYLESSNPSVNIASLRKQVRTDAIRMSTNFEVDSLGSLLQNNEIMRTALDVPEEVETDALAISSDRLSMLSTNTLMFNNQGDIDNPTLVATDLVDTSIKVMIASDTIMSSTSSTVNDSTTDGGFNETFTQVSSVMENVVVIIDDIMGMLNDGMEMNDPAAVLEYDDLTVMTSKIPAEGLDAMDFESHNGLLHLPPVASLLGENPPLCLRNQALFSGINPFIYGAQMDTAIGSSVLEFNLESCENPANTSRRRREVATTNGLLQPQVPFSVSVVPSTMEEPYYVERNLTSLNDYEYHILELSEPNLPVQIDVYPHPWNVTLHVAIGLNTWPSLWSSTWFTQLSVEQLNNSTEVPIVKFEGHYYMIYIPASNLTNGTLRIAVSTPDCSEHAEYPCPSESEPVTLNYSIRVMEVTCQVWNDTTQLWTNDNCELEGPVQQTSARFTSNLFGSLGVGVFVGPNTIDFGTVFNNLDQAIIDNLPVFVTVLLTMLLYIPLAIICRKYDKKDELKVGITEWQVLPIAGASVSGTYQYNLHVFTGFKKNAETNSNIQIVLVGTKGDSGVLTLSDSIRKNFNRGDVNSFSIGTEEDLGGIYMIRVWNDNSGQGKMASWFLSKIIVVDVERCHWYLFVCNNWLSVDKGDGLTDRVIRVTPKDSMDSGYLLRTNVNRKFYEDHIWLSIIFRQVYSPFTRVQRLSTAWALLFLTMIANAMWYRSSTESSDPVIFSIGIVSFTTYQLYSSFMSSLMVVPPILIISYCYSKAARRPRNNKDKPKQSDNTEDMHFTEDFDSITTLCPSRNSSELRRVVLEEGQNLRDENIKKLKGTKKLKGRWPYWVVYIAWVLVALSVVVAAFFTILYSFSWGGNKSTTWLIAFLLSFFQSVIIIQPVKVMCLAMILTMLFRQDTDMNPYEERYGEMQDAMDIFGDEDCILNENPWSGPDDNCAESHKHKRALEERVLILIKEIAHQVVFLVLLLGVCYSNQDDSIYRQNASLRSMFLHNEYKVTNQDKMWHFLKSTVLPNLFWDAYDNGQLVDSYENQFMADMSGFRLGQPRLRQLRVRPESCLVTLEMEHSTDRCTHWYSSHYPPLDNSNYLPHWRAPVNITDTAQPATASQSAFLYSTAEDINSAPVWANLHVYNGGGYVAVLGESLVEGLQALDALVKTHWVDHYTRAIFVKSSLLNSNSNLFSVVTLVFEFPPVGGVFKHYTFQTIKLYRYIGFDGIAVLVLEITTFLFFISVIYKFIRRCIKEKSEFILSVWGVSYVIVTLAFLVAVVLYILRSVWTVSTLEEVMNNRDRGVSFARVLIVDQAFMLLMGLVSFLVQMQFLYILRFSESIYIMGNTILKSKGDLACLCAFAVTVILGYASMGHMLYGPVFEAYHTIPTAVKTLCVSLIGEFDMDAHNKVGGLEAKIFLTSYLLGGIIILMNFFISLLNEFFSELKKDSGVSHEDRAVMEHLIHNIKSFFAFSDSMATPARLIPPKEYQAQKSHTTFTQVRKRQMRSRLIIISD